MYNTVKFLSTKSSNFIQNKLATVFHFGILILTALTIVLLTAGAYAAQVKVTFEPSPDSRAIGHNFYYCQSENLSKTSFSEKID